MTITEQEILDKLRSIHEPEEHENIVELGRINNIKIGGGNIGFDLVLPSHPPPVSNQLRQACIDAVRLIEGVGHVSVNLTNKSRVRPATEQKILPGVREVIAVASGKGGVGKSTTAVNLALALQERGAKVGLLDADIYGPSIPTMVRISEMPRPLADNCIEPAEGLGIKLVSMAFFMEGNRAAILRGPMVSGYVSQFLSKTNWGELDYLIIDYPPGTGDIQLTLSQQAPISGAVITTTPQEISLVDVRRAISMFETTEVPILGVCENMSYFICDQCDKRHDIFRSGGGERIARETGVPLLASIPIDPAVASGGDQGRPIVEVAPDSPAGEAFRDLAEGVAIQLAALRTERGNYLESFSLEWSAS